MELVLRHLNAGAPINRGRADAAARSQQEAQDALDEAADCLDDGGLFDWAECP
jgi:hypothetical protein